jgi:Cd2+/Zn2+-exporting ATPase
MIPVDGKVLKGRSYVDESMMTGESIPVDKEVGEKVFAGTMNLQGMLEIEVKNLPENSQAAKIREMTFSALKNKAKTQQFIEEFSSYYTPAILGLAALIAFLPPLLGVEGNSFNQALTLLVISCPCALVISTPISIFSAIGNASEKGVLIKGGRYLEAIGKIKAVAFDKTRTLTYGKPKLVDVIPYGDSTRQQLLACAAGLEVFSEHPLAQGIIAAAKGENLEPHTTKDFESVVGKGAKADCLICEGGHRCIGKLKFILEEHTVPSAIVSQIESLQAEGKTVIVISSHKKVEGLITLSDEIRTESIGVIRKLKAMGIETSMLTGDQEVTARAVADELGIREYLAEMSPEEKAHAVKQLSKRYGTVAMVGDGVNDAPALASAEVGISMTTLGSDVAIESAGIVILNDHLTMIPYMVRLGKEALTMIKFNTMFAIAIKMIFVFLAVVGLSHLALAIFADVGVTILVVLNSLRLLSFEK